MKVWAHWLVRAKMYFFVHLKQFSDAERSVLKWKESQKNIREKFWFGPYFDYGSINPSLLSLYFYWDGCMQQRQVFLDVLVMVAPTEQWAIQTFPDESTDFSVGIIPISEKHTDMMGNLYSPNVVILELRLPVTVKTRGDIQLLNTYTFTNTGRIKATSSAELSDHLWLFFSV